MGRLNRLTDLSIKKKTKPGRYADGGGLFLQVKAGASGVRKSWVFRYQNGQRERWMGLGPVETVTLKIARTLAIEARALRERDIDPLDHRNASRAATAAAAVPPVSFDECSAAYITAQEAAWRNPRYARNMRAALAAYVSPVFGKRPVAEINRALVRQALEPIWHKRSVTAGRLRGWIERILDFAEARDYRPEGSNPARLLPIKTALGRRPKKVKHFAALPYGDVSRLMADLRKRQGVPFRALEFLILCAARTGEVLGAKWSEIDLTDKTWAVPAERMKGGKEHRVPLSEAAVKLLCDLPCELGNDFVFIGSRGKGLGNRAMLLALYSLRRDVTVHGMRSTFRDWATAKGFANEVAEMALAHSVGDATKQAYRRDDLLNERCPLMAAWASYCAEAVAAGEVVTLRGKLARPASKS
jgi:integrase